LTVDVLQVAQLSQRDRATLHTQLYSPFEKAAQLYAKNESENLTNQQHKTLKRYLAQPPQ